MNSMNQIIFIFIKGLQYRKTPQTIIVIVFSPCILNLCFCAWWWWCYLNINLLYLPTILDMVGSCVFITTYKLDQFSCIHIQLLVYACKVYHFFLIPILKSINHLVFSVCIFMNVNIMLFLILLVLRKACHMWQLLHGSVEFLLTLIGINRLG
jgi:hypothetical protein